MMNKRVEKKFMLSMTDGCHLETNLYFPQQKNKMKYPVILKRSCYISQKEELEAQAQYFTEHGFVFVFQWCRGIGNSEGKWIPNVSEREDGVCTVQWLEKQDFTRNIGFWGDSYLAFNGWVMLDEVPDSVKSMFLGVYGVDRYASLYEAGMFRQDLMTSWAMDNAEKEIRADYLESYRYMPQRQVDEKLWGTHLDWYRTWIQKTDPEDPYWTEGFWGMLRRIPQKAKIPVYIREGWYDHHLKSALYSFGQLSEASKKHSVLEIGPWNHGYETVIPYEKYHHAESREMEAALKWFTETLVEEKKPQGRVRKYVIGKDCWITESACPVTEISFYLGKKSLKTGQTENGSISYRYDPQNPVFSHGTETMMHLSQEQGSLPQPPAGYRKDVISFMSDPLSEGILINGEVQVELYAASDAEDTAFTVKIIEERADGYALNIRSGLTTLAYRNQAPKRMSYKRYEIIGLTIRLTDICWYLRKGSRLRLDVSSSDFPQYAIHSNYAGVWSEQTETQPAKQTLYWGRDYPARVMLPTIKNDEE